MHEIGECYMIEYYEKIRDMDKNKRVISVVLMEGRHAGEKALWSEGNYQYKSRELDIWSKLDGELKTLNKAMYLEVEETKVFCEIMNGENHLVICGAGHVSIPVIKLGKMLGFHVTVIDDRMQFTNQAAKAGADRVICEDFMKALHDIEENINNYFVIVTRGHRYDQDCLISILKKASSYVGMIGSKLRVKTVKSAVMKQGFTQETVDNIYSPIGLNIGAETPEEIAVSIMAEIVEVKSKQNSNSGLTKELLERILTEDKLKMAMVTITKRKGSAPRNIGAKMLVLEDGTFLGSIGGGCAESSVFYDTLECIKEGRYKIETVDMTGNSYEEDGMVCGGIIEVFIEPLNLLSR
jgi:xanthine dehydrogenase accessory factor